MKALEIANAILHAARNGHPLSPTASRIHSTTEVISQVDQVLQRLAGVAPSTVTGWIACAHQQDIRLFPADPDTPQAPAWLDAIRFPVGGEGVDASGSTSWRLAFLGPAGWHWTTSIERPDDEAITFTDSLAARDGRTLWYRVCHASVRVGDHLELRPIDQRFIPAPDRDTVATR